jgi:threonine/homoserine efflux transporter RhtA
VGPEGVAALRLGLSALILLVVLRPWRIWRQANLRDLVGYGLMMGLMNLLIYRAFLYIPVGIAVSIEVIGPLGVALLSSRRRIDPAVDRPVGVRPGAVALGGRCRWAGPARRGLCWPLRWPGACT